MRRTAFIFMLSALLIGLISLIDHNPAYAAQDTTVVEDNAPIYAEPNDSSEIIEYLPQGTEVRTSSYPMVGGWYKVRSKMGLYGWVHESYLSVQQVNAVRNGKSPTGQPEPAIERLYVVRAFGGLDFWSPLDLNAVYSFEELDGGFTMGVEVGKHLNYRWSVLFRAEYLQTDVVAREVFTGLVYSSGIRSIPLMLGASYFVYKLPALKISAAAFAGLATQTKFSTEAINQTTPNSLTLEAMPLTFYARVNVTRPLGRLLSVFAEAGYRYLQTSELPTTDAASMNGGAVFLKSGTFKRRIIDLSGIVVAAGIGVHF